MLDFGLERPNGACISIDKVRETFMIAPFGRVSLQNRFDWGVGLITSDS